MKSYIPLIEEEQAALLHFTQEGFGDNISKFKDTVKAVFDYRRKNKQPDELNQLVKGTIDFNKNWDKTYLIPRGMSVDILQMIDILDKNQEFYNNILKCVIEPAIVELSSYLTIPNAINGFIKSDAHRSIVKYSAVGPAIKRFESAFSKRVGDEMKLVHLIGSESNWSVAIKEYNALITKLKMVNPTQVNGSIDKLSEISEVLYQRLTETPEDFNITKETTKNIANVIYLVAKMVESYSAHVFAVEQLGGTMDRIQLDKD